MKILWTEIEDVYIYTRRIGEFNIRHGYIVATTNGGKINIDSSVKDIGELIQLIQDKIYELKIPQYREKYGKGEKISFGLLSVNRDGITRGDENIVRST